MTIPWIAAGILLTVLAGNRAGVPLLLWVAAVPWLVAAVHTRGRAWIGLLLAVFLAQTLVVLKIVTAPMPPAMALLFSVPATLGAAVLLALFSATWRRVGPLAAIWLFAALTTIGDWSGYTHSDLSAWTASANGFATDTVLMQLTSVVGLAGVGALVAFVQGVLAAFLLNKRPWRHTIAAAVLVLVALTWGAWRLDAGVHTGPTVRVAAITTRLGPGSGGLPADAERVAEIDALFERSRMAANRGAQLVVWNEAAAMIRPNEEATLMARGADFARAHRIDLVLAYAIAVELAPLRYRNEYAWFGPDGAVVEVYAKHHPVPGEPSIRGDAPLVVHARPYGVVAGAICYDWDFPAVGRSYAAQGAGLVVVPSSDWRGIDPLHTQMAAVRAIESGVSVLRPVRDAASAGFDAYGRPRGWMAADGDGVLVLELPITPVATLYRRWGDTPMLAGAGMVLVAVALLAIRTLRRR